MIVFAIIAAYLIISNFVFFPTQIISYDIYGYYLYLPQTFIFHDLSMHNPSQVLSLMEQYGSSSTFYQATILPDGTYVMKYSMGLAILYSPFFFIAHALAPVFGYAADGYSFPYQLSLFLGGLMYSIAGFWFLRKVLLKYFSEIITSISLLLIVAATNIPVHMAMYGQNAMSHNYLFALYCMALWFTIQWHETFRMKFIIYLGIVCGLAVLSRPTEIVILAIPVFWNVFSWNSFKEKFNILRKHYGQIFLFGAIVFSIGFLQLIYWKIHTGHFLYYSYSANPGEGLELFSPYISQFLFSFRKGWIIYTPIMLFAFAGFYFMYKNNRKIFLSVLAYTLFNLYLISSWSTWWYAQSFSQRPMVPALAVLVIPLGYFIQWLLQQKIFTRTILSVVIAFLVFLNIFQIWQFHVGIIDGERMTKAYYEKIFLRTSVSDEDKKLLLIDRAYYEANGFTNMNEYNGRLLKTESFENQPAFDTIAPVDGKSFATLTQPDSYSALVEAPYSEITNCDHAWIRVGISIYPVTHPDSLKLALVAHFAHKGFAYQYRTIESPAMHLKQGEWNRVYFNYLTPEVRKKSDLFRTFLWNMSGGTVLVDQLSVEVFEPKAQH